MTVIRCTCMGHLSLRNARLAWIITVLDPYCGAHGDARVSGHEVSTEDEGRS